MAADVATGVRQVFQDLVAPDVKALQAKVDALAKQVDTSTGLLARQLDLQFNAVMNAIDAFRAEMRSELSSVRSANQFEVARQIGPLSE
jgi:hypothetical protein